MKSLVKRLISEGLRCTDVVRGAVSRWSEEARPGECVILYYHGVPEQQADSFAAQMQALVEVAQPIPASYEGPLEAGRRYVMVTFDDGFRSVVEHALPVLEKRNIPAAIFVPTGFLGRPPSWGRYSNAHASGESVLSESELRRLAANPLVEIGSHTVHHVSLQGRPEPEVRGELLESRRSLQEILTREVFLFSFPHGASDPLHMAWAREAGYRRVFTICPERVTSRMDRFVVGRVAATPDDAARAFFLKLVGAERWMASCR